MEKLRFLLGSDPEFIVTHGNECIPMCGKFGGTKEEPEPIKELGSGYYKSEDNVLIEFNIPPSDSVEGLLDNINTVIGYGNKFVRSINPEYRVSFLSSGNFDVSHPQAQVFGCDPSYSVIRKEESYRPDPSTVGGLRSSAFHIHFSKKEVHEVVNTEDFILLCDLFLGIPSLVYDNSKPSIERKLLYGNLSDFRVSSKTIEYRTLGTSMLLFPNLVREGIHNINRFMGKINPWDYIESLERIDYKMLHNKPYEEDAKKLLETINTRIKNEHLQKFKELGYIDILVYGTLKRGFHNDIYLLGSELIEPNYTTEAKYTMYNGSFPIVSTNGNTSIKGEIYRVTSIATLRGIFLLEGFSGIQGSSENWYDVVFVKENTIMFVMDNHSRTEIIKDGIYR